MESMVETEIKRGLSDDEVAELLYQFIETRKIVAWREICEINNVSVQRIKRILEKLVRENRVVELPCRLFTTASLYKSLPRNELKKMIAEKLFSLNLRKCSPYLCMEPKITVTIKRNSNVIIVDGTEFHPPVLRIKTGER